MALLRLAQGRVDVAAAQLRRLLAETEQPIARARVLCAAAEILLAAGDVEGARSAADKLSAVATELGSPLLRAHAALATGSVLLAVGDAPVALVALRRAAGEWSELSAPYEGARTRLRIADACEARSDLDGAELERRAAPPSVTHASHHEVQDALPGHRLFTANDREIDRNRPVLAGDARQPNSLSCSRKRAPVGPVRTYGSVIHWSPVRARPPPRQISRH
jgi:ATP/maltotriose-dependent transcriptional regulator MalT